MLRVRAQHGFAVTTAGTQGSSQLALVELGVASAIGWDVAGFPPARE